MRHLKFITLFILITTACSAPSFKANSENPSAKSASDAEKENGGTSSLPGGGSSGANSNGANGGSNTNQNGAGTNNSPNGNSNTTSPGGSSSNTTFPGGNNSNTTFPGSSTSGIPGYASGARILCSNEPSSTFNDSADSGAGKTTSNLSYSRSCQSGLMNGLYGGGLIVETMRPDLSQNVMSQPSCCRLPAEVGALPVSPTSQAIQSPDYNNSNSGYTEVRQTCPAQFPILSGYQGQWAAGAYSGIGKPVQVTRMNCNALLANGKNLSVDMKPENLRYVNFTHISMTSQGEIGLLPSRVTCPDGMVAIGHYVHPASYVQVAGGGGQLPMQLICAFVIVP